MFQGSGKYGGLQLNRQFAWAEACLLRTPRIHQCYFNVAFRNLQTSNFTITHHGISTAPLRGNCPTQTN